MGRKGGGARGHGYTVRKSLLSSCISFVNMTWSPLRVLSLIGWRASPVPVTEGCEFICSISTCKVHAKRRVLLWVCSLEVVSLRNVGQNTAEFSHELPVTTCIVSTTFIVKVTCIVEVT